MLRRFRKSGQVTLVLLGVAALAACTDDTRRDVYKSREDCLADWGNKPEDCTRASDPRHAGMGYFYGPMYAYRSWGSSGSSWTSGGARGNHSAFSTSTSSGVSRGGFGATGHSSAG